MATAWIYGLALVYFDVCWSETITVTNQCSNLTYVAPIVAGDNVTLTFVPFKIDPRLSVTWKTATATSSTGFFSISNDWKYQPTNLNLLIKTNEGDQGRIIYAQYGNCKSEQIDLRLHWKPNDPVFVDAKPIGDCKSCIVGAVGSPLVILCLATNGSEPLTVRVKFAGSDLKTQHMHGRLYMARHQQITEDDHQAPVTCSVDNSALASPLVTLAHVYIKAPITAVKLTYPNTSLPLIPAGKSSSFVCESSLGRPAASVYWYKRTKDGHVTAISSATSNTLAQGTLVKTRSTLKYAPAKHDNGTEIYCKANNTNSNSDMTSSVLELMVQESRLNVNTKKQDNLVITTYTLTCDSVCSSSDVREGWSVTLHCEADASAFITLDRDGQTMSNATNVTVLSYALVEVTCADSGIYTCTAVDRHRANDTAVKKMQVNIKCKPRPVDGLYNHTLYKSIGESVVLSIRVSAYPDPTLYTWWQKTSDGNWTELTARASSTGLKSRLDIGSLQEHEFGLYMAVVANTEGSMEQFFIISQKDKPVQVSEDPDLPMPTFVFYVGGAAIVVIVTAIIGIVCLVSRKRRNNRTGQVKTDGRSQRLPGNNTGGGDYLSPVYALQQVDNNHTATRNTRSKLPNNCPDGSGYVYGRICESTCVSVYAQSQVDPNFTPAGNARQRHPNDALDGDGYLLPVSATNPCDQERRRIENQSHVYEDLLSRNSQQREYAGLGDYTGPNSTAAGHARLQNNDVDGEGYLHPVSATNPGGPNSTRSGHARVLNNDVDGDGYLHPVSATNPGGPNSTRSGHARVLNNDVDGDGYLHPVSATNPGGPNANAAVHARLPSDNLDGDGYLLPVSASNRGGPNSNAAVHARFPNDNLDGDGYLLPVSASNRGDQKRGRSETKSHEYQGLLADKVRTKEYTGLGDYTDGRSGIPDKQGNEYLDMSGHKRDTKLYAEIKDDTGGSSQKTDDHIHVYDYIS